MQYCFDNQDDVLGSTDKTYNQIITSWTTSVATKFGFKQADLAALYDYDTDTHNSEMRGRYMWKYSTNQGVSSTPSAFINGVMVQVYPGGPDDWMQILNDIISDQNQSSSLSFREFLN